MVVDDLAAYIPIDRCFALARGAALPGQDSGSVLFADLSGFTPLSNTLARELGPQRGAEELSRQLNSIYSALIAQVKQFHGAGVAVAGGAITSWFWERLELPGAGEPAEAPAGANAVDRAAACALQMQRIMAGFASVQTPGGAAVALAIKVVVTYGTVRRFVVGDPAIQLIDTMAGAPLNLITSADKAARRGEVLLAAEAVGHARCAPQVVEWRPGEDGSRGFAVIDGLAAPVEPEPWPALDLSASTPELLRPWLLPAVYARLAGGQGQFLAELRPAVAVFVQFDGIDYDGDPDAGLKLDALLRWAQAIVARFDGALLQLTIGDKGSSFYCTFGAPQAHENDEARAAQTALLLRDPPPDLGFLHALRIGISQGRMRTGAYGGYRRWTYGVLGEEVNMAARLMQAAGPGQIYVSALAQQSVANEFAWELLPPLPVKGRDAPLTAYKLLGAHQRPPAIAQSARYGLPLVGREAELDRIRASMDLAFGGHGQIVAVLGEAGLGKSRLVVEGMRLAVARGMAIFAGEAQSYGTNDSYLTWEPIWQLFFGLNRAASPADQIAALAAAVEAIDPALLPRLPLLSAVLNLSIPDNDLTRSLDSRLRKLSLESLLVSCLRARSRANPIMLLLEDAHWLDPLSHDLLEQIGRAIADLPVLIVVAMRPPELQHLLAPRVLALENCAQITLAELSPGEAAELVQLKQVHLDMASELPPDVVDRLVARSQGNPFFIEELLNYLHNRGLAPRTAQELEQLDMPSSLYSLILSRIDQLSEAQKTTLKVAAVIGRLFRAAWLWGVLPDLGKPRDVHSDLDALSRLELTLLDQPEPDSVYLFKHILTHGVAYESLPFATRSWLHGEVGSFIERVYGDNLQQFVDVLAYHFDLSQDQAKRRRYLRLAGEAAQAAFANPTAVDYYRRLLALLDEGERGPVQFRLAQVQELIGEWQAAEAGYKAALALAERAGDRGALVECQRAIGWLHRKQADYGEALRWLELARAGYAALGAVGATIQTIADIGEVYRLQGDYAQAGRRYEESLALAEGGARTPELLAARANALKGAGNLAVQQGHEGRVLALFEESLAIRRELNDRAGIAAMLNNLGVMAERKADFVAAAPLFEESLTLFRQLGDRWSLGFLLNNLAVARRHLGQRESARALLEESVAVRRSLGDKWGIANSLSSLANMLLHEGNLAPLPPMLRESLELNLEIGDREALAYCLEDYAGLAAGQGQHRRALRLAGAAAALRAELGAPLPAADQANLDRLLAPARAALGTDGGTAFSEGQALAADDAVALALAMDGA
jgi:class 3 adenylate cyclase/tetratricopeptide (TPR) repeat protein